MSPIGVGNLSPPEASGSRIPNAMLRLGCSADVSHSGGKLSTRDSGLRTQDSGLNTQYFTQYYYYYDDDDDHYHYLLLLLLLLLLLVLLLL